MTNPTIDSAVKKAAESLIELLEHRRERTTKTLDGQIVPTGDCDFSYTDNDEKVADAVSKLRDALRDRTL